MSATWEIREGDALERLREMPDESVQCCVTSPPYFGLRDYGTGEWEGGEDGCDHVRALVPRGPDDPGIRRSTLDGGKRTTTAQAEANSYRDVCGKCGARRTDRQIGLEATPDEFVARLVEVFREVRRVLRSDGTLWLNIGDSYTAGAGSRNGLDSSGLKRNVADETERQRCLIENKVYRAERVAGVSTGVKPKDLLGIPWLLAFALRADGWWLRSDIIWAKPNPMPESVTDRPTSAHEHVFLLAKSARYFWDADAIREEGQPSGWAKQRDAGVDTWAYGRAAGGTGVDNTNGVGGTFGPAGRNKRNVWEIATQPFSWRQNARQVRVEPDDADDDTTRITSPDCPVHGGRRCQPTAPGDERAGGDPIRTGRTDDRPAQGSLDGLASTGQNLEPSPAGGSSGSPARAGSPTANAHSTESRRTVSRSASGDTASERTAGRTGDTSLSHGMPALDGSGSPGSSQTRDRTAHKPACTCRYYRLGETDHFATFPPKLVEPCVLAGSSPTACGECGAPWVRVVERKPAAVLSSASEYGNGAGRNDGGRSMLVGASTTTIGWQSSCAHEDDTGRSVILDPFAGAGTTGLVALRHDRSFIGIELSPAYAEMARERIRQDAPLLNTPAEAAA